MRQVFNVFAALFIAIGLMLTTGCKEKEMDLPPEGYFTGQQLVLAKAIRDGNIGDIKRLAKETDLNSPGEHDMTLLFLPWRRRLMIMPRRNGCRLRPSW